MDSSLGLPMVDEDQAACGPVSSAGGPPDEEFHLWRAWRTNHDPSARQALLSLHMPYAKVIAAMVYGQRTHDGVEFEDYLQFSRVGLLEAFERYDPAAGAQFRTFAARRMRGAVLDGLGRMTEQQQQLALRRRLTSERTASVAMSESGAVAGVDLFQYLAEVGIGLAVGLMLDGTAMFHQAEQERTGAIDPSYQSLELRQTQRQLMQLVRQLPDAERRVIQMHYEQGYLFGDIAREMALTKGRVSQIHKCAVTSLRRLLAERNPCDRAF